jgi:hypothetical protein
VTIASRPFGWDETARNTPVIWVWCEEEIFLHRGLDMQISDLDVVLVLCHRIVINGSGKPLTAHQGDPVACSIGRNPSVNFQ